jgi:hypothetical protein
MRVLVTLFGLVSVWCAAQPKPDMAIQTPIKNLFLAMEKGDSTLLRTAFHTDLTMITVLEKEGKFTLRKETDLKGFATAVGTPKMETLRKYGLNMPCTSATNSVIVVLIPFN